MICVGRNVEKATAFTLDVGKGDRRYAYQQIHVVHEQDRLIELFDAEQPQVIINFAALADAASWSESSRYYDTNLMALVKIVQELTKRDYLDRWIQIGTSELYGSLDYPATEDTPLNPSSPYAVSKAAADMHLLCMWNSMQFPMNIIRPSNAYGPGQQLRRVIPRAVLCGLTGQKLPLHGGGHARKSYFHARDLARAIYMVSEKAPPGRIYHAGPPTPISIREIIEVIAEKMHIPFDELCEVTPDRPGEDSQYWLDNSAIKRDAGWEYEIELGDGIEEMIDWGKQYLDFLRAQSTEYVLHA